MKNIILLSEAPFNPEARTLESLVAKELSQIHQVIYLQLSKAEGEGSLNKITNSLEVYSSKSSLLPKMNERENNLNHMIDHFNAGLLLEQVELVCSFKQWREPDVLSVGMVDLLQHLIIDFPYKSLGIVIPDLLATWKMKQISKHTYVLEQADHIFLPIGAPDFGHETNVSNYKNLKEGVISYFQDIS